MRLLHFFFCMSPYIRIFSRPWYLKVSIWLATFLVIVLNRNNVLLADEQQWTQEQTQEQTQGEVQGDTPGAETQPVESLSPEEWSPSSVDANNPAGEVQENTSGASDIIIPEAEEDIPVYDAGWGGGSTASENEVTVELGKLYVDDIPVDALLKKDTNQEIREVEVAQEKVITGDIGVTVIIPENTIIFSPETEVADTATVSSGTNATTQSSWSISIWDVWVGEHAAGGDTSTWVGTIDGKISQKQETLTGQDQGQAGDWWNTQIGSSQTSWWEHIGSSDVTQSEGETWLETWTEAWSETWQVLSGDVRPEELRESATLEEFLWNQDPFAWQDKLQSTVFVMEEVAENVGDWEEKGDEEAEKVFTFGMTGQNLVFSKPVEIRVAFPGQADETEVLLSVKHVWDEIFTTKGLSISPNATCDGSGNIRYETTWDTLWWAQDILQVKALVHDESVTFYTCGASEFAVSLVSTFNPNANSTIASLAVYTWETLMVGWAFTTMNGQTKTRIARVHASWSVDVTFSGNASSTVNAMVVDSGDYIIIWWAFTTVAWITKTRMARITTTWGVDRLRTGNVNNTIFTMIPQSDQKIIIGWQFTQVRAASWTRIARTTATGWLDRTFTGTLNGTVYALALQPDDKIVLGGMFTSVDRKTISRIARVTTTGTLDTSFTGNVNGTVNALALQTDGKVVIGGQFTTVNGTNKSRLARLTSTGTLDTTFTAEITWTWQVSTILVAANGSIIIGGTFTGVSGMTRNRIARIFSNGTLDTTFDPNANNAVSALAMNTHSVYVGWAFTNIGWYARNRIARIWLVPSMCAGTSGCSLWLKADTGITTGSWVSSWRSQWAQDITWVQTTWSRQPSYLTNTMNFNPIVRFDGSDDGLIVANRNGFLDNDNAQYVVFKTTANNGTITALATATWFAATSCERWFWLSGWKLMTVLGGERITSASAINTNRPMLVSRSYGTWNAQSISLNGKLEVTGTARRPTVTTDINMLVWRATTQCFPWGLFSWSIAEIVTFNRRLSAAEELDVEGYLALKYGIQIDQSTPTDYTIAGWLTPWSASAAWAYTSDIAGIGREDESTLNQTVSQSANDTGDIIVQFTGALTDDMFMVRWNNDQSNTGRVSTDVAAWYQRIARERKFEENYGDMWSVVVRVLSWSLPVPLTWAMIMFLDGDGVMADATTVTGTLSGEAEWIFEVNISDGEYITFGTQEIETQGTLNIWSPTSLGITWATSLSEQTIEYYYSGDTSMYFLVDDGQGLDNGYTTTLQLSGNLTAWPYTIASTSASFKAASGTVVLLSGTANADVLIDTNATAYQSLDTARTLIYRNIGANGDITWGYGTYIRLSIVVPGAQPWGWYQWTLVYTIIEN